jgi:ribonuclease Z
MSETEVIITGSGTPIPVADRAGPGVLVRRGDVTLQFDAGRSTVQRLTAAGVWIPHLTAFFATHHHSDHLTALQDLVLTAWVMDRDLSNRSLPIVVPAGPAESFARRMLDAWDHDLAVRMEHAGRTVPPQYEVIAFEYPEQPTEVWSTADVRVLAGQVRHEPVHPAVGYRIETPEGAIAITGDTLVCDEVAELADGCDVLVYEAMRFEPVERRPPHLRFILDYHADTRLIGRQAAELGVPTLILTHLIPPPRDDAERQAFVDDIRNGGFEGELIVADDLDRVVLTG